VAAKILGHIGNYSCQQVMLLPLRVSDLLRDESRTMGFGYPPLANMVSSASLSQSSVWSLSTSYSTFCGLFLQRRSPLHRGTFLYEKALRRRSVWVEPLFAEARD
jgi:hypothetical protein